MLDPQTVTSENTMTWTETWRLICSDFQAYREFFKLSPGLKTLINLVLLPGFMAVTLYRLSHACWCRGWWIPTKLLSLIMLTVTGAEINPSSVVGEGFVVLHPMALLINGRIGRRVVMAARSGLDADGSLTDIGGGPGCPVLGDRIFFGADSTVFGPYRVGDGVVIFAHSLILSDIPAGAKAFGIPAKILPPSMIGPTRRQASKPVTVSVLNGDSIG